MKPARHSSVKRRLAWAGSSTAVLVGALVCGGLWFSTNQLLAPSFKGVEKNLSVCKPETEKAFGTACGNLRETHEFAFSEVSVPSRDDYTLPGWLVRTADNGRGPSKGAILLVHAGGSDRREDTRHIKFYLDQGLDVLTFDCVCSGEAPCPTKGLSYGDRESRDVLAAYLYLTATYDNVYAMGSSVGAASILIALHDMPRLAGVVAENPYASFGRLIKEAPQSKSMPVWAVNSLISAAKARGKFDGLRSPERSLPAVTARIPILFIHSKADQVVSYRQTEDLARLYKGPATVWLPEQGDHALIQNANRVTYESRIAEFLRRAP